MKRFEIIEDNGGGLHLFTFGGDGKCDYAHTGYEYHPGQLSADLKRLWAGEDPATDWAGNCGGYDWEYGTDPEALHCELIDSEDRDVVGDNDRMYPEKMGAAARLEFRP